MKLAKGNIGRFQVELQKIEFKIFLIVWSIPSRSTLVWKQVKWDLGVCITYIYVNSKLQLNTMRLYNTPTKLEYRIMVSLTHCFRRNENKYHQKLSAAQILHDFSHG